MSLILPYFKMDVIDWLKSEKIEQMSTACIGAYILLLCEAWTRPCCSLPSARLALMKLGRWTGTPEEFEPVCECFEPLKGDKSRVVNVRLKYEWDQAHATMQALSEAGKKGAQVKQQLRESRQKKPAPHSNPASTDFEQFWAAYPKKEGRARALLAWKKAKEKPGLAELLQALDIAKQTAQWKKENGQYIPQPARWLREGRWTDQPFPNGQAVSLKCPTHPHLTFADEKAKDTHDFLYHPKYVG